MDKAMGQIPLSTQCISSWF